jgi:hypothetical protein
VDGQESEGREEAVRADVRLEAANQHHQLNVRRAALKEELAHDFAALVHDEVRHSTTFRDFEPTDEPPCEARRPHPKQLASSG